MYSVSVIMPVFNNEDTLEAAIQSVLNQSIYGLELILVDNGSTDSSARICDNFVKKEPLVIELINQPSKKGMSHALNQGLIKSKGKYVYFANPNNTFDSKMLEANIDLAEEKETELVVFGFTKESESNSNLTQNLLPNLPFLSHQEEFRKHFRNFYHFYPYVLFNKLYNREFLLKNRVSFIDAPAREDAFFNLKVFKDINRVAFNRTAYLSPHKNKLSPSPGLKNNRYKTNIKLANYFETIMKYWRYENEFEDLIAKEFVNVVLHELESISEGETALSNEEQINYIDSIIQNNKILYHLNNPDIRKDYSPHQRALINNLSEGKSDMAVQIAQRRNKTSFKVAKIKNIIKNFIKR